MSPKPAARGASAAPLPLAPPLALVALLTALIALTGCNPMPAKPDLAALGTPEGKACAARCDLPKTQCQQRQRARESDCGAVYAVAQANYDQCVKTNAGRCRAPYTCLGADLTICDQELDDCYAACAARVGPRTVANAAREGAAVPSQESAPAAAPAPAAAKPTKADPP